MADSYVLTTTVPHGPEHDWRWSRLGLTAAALAALPGAAYAGFVQPVGVSAYRLMFTTAESISGIASTFAPYDLFAQNSANAAGDLPSATWLAVVSVAGTSAVDHINCATCDPTIPIFMVDGTQVATSANAMFAGTFINTPEKDQFGTATPAYSWTGSEADGTPAAGHTMGTAEPAWGAATAGAPNVFRWNGAVSPQKQLQSIYAISDTIFVPEPATGATILAGGLVVTRVLRRRRQRKAA
ncbi:MAG: hypothetical protein U1E70_11910 [Acetobacteraceae bacterium]